MIKNFSVKQKLTLIILATAGISVFLAVMATGYFNIKFLNERFQKELELTSNLLSENLSGALAFDDKERISEVLKGLKSNSSIVQACVYDSENLLVESFFNTPNGHCSEGMRNSPAVKNENSIINIVQIKQGETTYGILTIEANLKHLQASIKNQLAIIFASAVSIILLCAWPLANILQRSISKPIGQLVSVTQDISIPDFKDGRIQEWSSDEIYLLSQKLKALKAYFLSLEKDLRLKNETAQAIKTNKDMALEYLQQEARETLLASRFSLYLMQNRTFGTIDKRYQDANNISFKESQRLIENIVEISDLSYFESDILDLKKLPVNVEEVIHASYENVFFPLPKSSIQINRDGALSNWPMYECHFQNLVENIFSMFHHSQIAPNEYQTSVEIEEDYEASPRALNLNFTFSCLHDYKSADKPFDFEKDEVVQKLFNAKYSYNFIAPFKLAKTLNCSFYDNKAVISFGIPWDDAHISLV